MSVIYDTISTRDAFGIALKEKGDQDDTIYAIGADTTKSMGFGPFMKAHPDRVLNIGIAEQNMALAGAGAAACGAKAIIATYATFASMRICEQIRSFICYPNLDVKIISGLGGLSGNIEGVTHQGIEDIGVLRSIPNLAIVVPADAASTVVISRAILDHTGPVYLRIGRGPVETVFDDSYTFAMGKANPLRRDGDDAVLFCNGAAVARTLHAADLLKQKNIKVRVVEVPCVKPLDSECIIATAKACELAVTVEEHTIIGGLGSAVSEVLADQCPMPLLRIGIDDMYTESGPHSQLLDKYNLSATHIATTVEEKLRSCATMV